MKTSSKKNLKSVAVVAVLTLVAGAAVAGSTGGGEFDSIWTTIKGWIEGTLGMIIAGAMILVGVVAGVVRQSLMGFVVGFAGGMGLYNAPAVISAIFGATIMKSEAAVSAAITLSNGLL